MLKTGVFFQALSNPDQILFDTRSGYVIYVLKTNNPAVKLSVKFDYAKKGVKTNMIVSAFKQSVSTIAEMIKGKVYERIKWGWEDGRPSIQDY